MKDRYLLAEVRIVPPGGITPEGRDAIVAFLRRTANDFEKSSCGSATWSQPARFTRLKMAR